MKTKHFVEALDHARITSAIADAETRTSGQLRVFVSHKTVDDALPAARERFQKLGMEKTVERNGILIFFAPEARRYAVVGDQGIHERCGGDEFWQTVVDKTMRPLLQSWKFYRGNCAGYQRDRAAACRPFSTPHGWHRRERIARHDRGRLKPLGEFACFIMRPN